jgi:RNA polymerase sigma-70 factor (ECF subfamily)
VTDFSRGPLVTTRRASSWLECPDEKLLEATAGGEEEAFVEIYRRYRQRVYRFAYHMSGSAMAAEDVTHGAFLSLLESPRRFRPGRAALGTYLCAVARNLNLKRLRKTRREVLREAPAPGTAGEGDPLEALLEDERARVVRAAVLRLAPLHREVVLLADLEELDLASVAEIVGAGVGTVKVRLHRARRKLRQWLAADAAEPGRQWSGTRRG